MKIKDLFQKGEKAHGQSLQNINELERKIESYEFVKATTEQNARVIPQVNFSNPNNFAFWGLAEDYYEDAFSYIAETYPYDGSLAEKIAWNLSSSFLDIYLFENSYPRTNGYITLGRNYGASQGASQDGYEEFGNNEFISFVGGPHTSSGGMENKPLYETFTGSSVYDEDKNRQNNLALNLTNGVGIEFWLKKPTFSTGNESDRQIVLDVWNNQTIGSTSYGRFRVEIKPGILGQEDEIRVVLVSGSTSNTFDLTSAGTIANNEWKHYSVFLKNNASIIRAELYNNGIKKDTDNSGTAIGEITGSFQGRIGALITSASVGIADAGWGKLSGSLDEFRFWKTRRTAEQVGRYWFTQIGGGTNTDDANTTLGLYYKFNEGIVSSGSTHSRDAIILDYSGRFSNGSWTGYSVGARSTSSAIVESKVSTSEFQDPIIYKIHPAYISTLKTLKQKGREHDLTNNSALYNSLPRWIRDEDEKKSRFSLRKFTQTLASVFDSLHLQINEVPKLQNTRYPSGSLEPYPFASRFLSNFGIISPDLFMKSDELEALANRDDKQEFGNKFETIKNTLLTNLYNNLVPILRAKGTEKAFKNSFHCFGVGDELVKLNIYADNSIFQIRDNFRSTTIRRNFVDFNNPDRFDASVYSWTGSDGNGISYIDLRETFPLAGATYEAEAIFPKKFGFDSELHFYTSFLTASVFGAHSASSNNTDLTWETPDESNFQVQAIKTQLEGKDVYFQLTGTSNSLVPTLTSPVFPNVYDNSNWNFFVRFTPNFPADGIVSGSQTGSYKVEFIGIQKSLDITENKFSVSGNVSSFNVGRQQLFCGAHRTNATGSTLQQCDAKISNVRVFATALNDDVLDVHAKDASNFGTEFTSRNFLINLNNSKINVPYWNARVLDWNFANITSSGDSSDSLPTTSDAKFDVIDISSGSSSHLQFGKFSTALDTYSPARGDFFLPFDENAINKEFVYVAKQLPVEVINSSNMIENRAQDDELFTRESRPVRHYFAFEKSYNAILSDEMMNYFASIEDFNNIIGDPVNRYRPDYKIMSQLRRLFFERNGEKASFEKFVDFYKWIDNSLNDIIYQLMPASANASVKMRNVIESHLLERNKYWNKFPTLEFDVQEPETAINGINRLLYSGKDGIAPASLIQDRNETWWSKTANRNEAPLATGDTDFDNKLQLVFQPIKRATKRSFGTPLRLTGSTTTSASVQINNVISTKNIKYPSPLTGSRVLPLSSSLGNYRLDYEIIQTSGRHFLNRAFIKTNGFEAQTSSVADFINIGTNDYPVPDRTLGTNKWVIIERFNAPGGSETMSPLSMDFESEQFSVYNVLPWRNFEVRRNLEDDYKLTQSLDNNNPTTHKTPPNGCDSGNGKVYDNWFVQRPIPGCDLHYAWITQSAKTGTQPFGYRNTNFSIHTGSANGTPENFNFVSASELNPQTINFGTNKWGVIDVATNVVPVSSSSSDSVNDLVIANQGVFGASSWEFIRNNRHPASIYFQRNNIYSLPNGITTFTASNGSRQTARKDSFTNYYEPPIDNRAKPMVHSFIDKDDNEVSFRHPFGLNRWKFSNRALANRLGVDECDTTAYDKFKELYKDIIVNPENLPVKGLSRLSFGQTIFPKGMNAGRQIIRGRTNYKEVAKIGTINVSSSVVGDTTNNFIATASYGNNGIDRSPLERRTFWRDDIHYRIRTEFITGNENSDPLTDKPTLYTRATPLINSQGITDGRAWSLWPLATSISLTSSVAHDIQFVFPNTILEQSSYNAFLSNDTAELNRDVFYLLTTDPDSTNTNQSRSILNWFFGVVFGADDVEKFFYSYPTASMSYWYEGYAAGNHVVPTDGTGNNDMNAIIYTMFKPRYRTHIFAGKNPWFDGYDEFSKDIKRIGKDYSVLPEFSISKHIPYYVDEKGGNFRARNDEFLTIDGGNITQSAENETNGFTEDFFKNFVHSDVINDFELLQKDHEDIAEISTISLTCKGIKKLLPYNGFYPQTRTLQLGTLLSQSIAPYISGLSWSAGQPSGTNSSVYSGSLAIQSMLQPFVAPGVLFNSIKSGVAVDWAIFTGSSYTTGSNSGVGGTLTGTFNYRIPFEALANIKNGVGNGGLPVGDEDNTNDRIYFLSPEHRFDILAGPGGGAREPYFIWNGDKKPLFELGANNFLGESVKFFLKDGEMKTFISSPENRATGKMISGTTYFMDVVLRKSDNFTMAESQVSLRNPSGTNNISFDGSLFGPSCKTFTSDIGTNTDWPLVDPKQCPYTPPYFYGESIARLKYVADGTEITNTIGKVLSKLETENFNDKLFDKIIHYNSSVHNITNEGFATASTAWTGRMNVSSSINFKGVVRNKQITFSTTEENQQGFIPQQGRDAESSAFDRWVISPRMEFPVLNFAKQQKETLEFGATGNIASINIGSFFPGVGMWSGYGDFPIGDEGIFFELRESFPGVKEANTGSLIDVFGFDTTPQRIGEIADEKEISEAIVAIPFIDNPTGIASPYALTTNILGKHFFSISRSIYNKQLRNKLNGEDAVEGIEDTSISDMAVRLQNYILPPEIDFTTYEDINPFVVYLFEFKHTLDRQDLADIWQGVMPKIAMRMEEDEINITHETGENEFFAGRKLPPNVRFMLFKIKRKGEKSYFNVTADSKDDDRFQFDFRVGTKAPEYSYNWPYDYFSLVEMAKLDIEFEMKPKEKGNTPAITSRRRDITGQVKKF